MRRGGEEIRGVLGFWWEKGLGRRETRGKRKGMSISTTHKTGIGPSGRAAEGDTGGFGWWPRKDECLKTSASCTGKRLPGISIVDFLFIFLIISVFMHLSGRFWLSFVTWVYYCSVFFVTFSWHSLKDIWIWFESCHRPWSPLISAWNGFPHIESFVCLFVILNVLYLGSFISVFGISILVFVSGSHLWGLLWMSRLCFGMPEERGCAFQFTAKDL